MLFKIGSKSRLRSSCQTHFVLSLFPLQTVLGILVPPTITSKEFKTRKELCQMPVTFEEHELEQTKRDEEETGKEEKCNGNTAHFTKGDSQIHLR